MKLSKQKQRVYFRGTQWCLRRSIPRGAKPRAARASSERELSLTISVASRFILRPLHASEKHGDDNFQHIPGREKMARREFQEGKVFVWVWLSQAHLAA